MTRTFLSALAALRSAALRLLALVPFAAGVVCFRAGVALELAAQTEEN